MISLIYLSSATHNMCDEALVKLLEESKENNERLGITGLLLYRDGDFLQVLEGDAEAVEKIYDDILKDPRHTGVIRVLKQEIEEREFSDWKMGFINLDEVNPDDIPGFSDFLHVPLKASSFEGDPSFTQSFLRAFKRVTN